MTAERQKQVLLRELQEADAAAAAVAHEAEVRREYTALRIELHYPETVPDRHMMLSSMETKIVEMKRELLRLQVLRQEQQAVNALRSQQQHQAALAAAEREAKKPKPPPRQVSTAPCRPFTLASRARSRLLLHKTRSTPATPSTGLPPPLCRPATGLPTVLRRPGACRSSSCRRWRLQTLPRPRRHRLEPNHPPAQRPRPSLLLSATIPSHWQF
jgi:hypothetical protein